MNGTSQLHSLKHEIAFSLSVHFRVHKTDFSRLFIQHLVFFGMTHGCGQIWQTMSCTESSIGLKLTVYWQ